MRAWRYPFWPLALLCFAWPLVECLESASFGVEGTGAPWGFVDGICSSFVTGFSGLASDVGIHSLRVDCSGGTSTDLLLPSSNPQHRPDPAQPSHLFNITSATGFDAIRVGVRATDPPNPVQLSVRQHDIMNASMPWSYPPIGWATVQTSTFDCAAATVSPGEVWLMTRVRASVGLSPADDGPRIVVRLVFTCTAVSANRIPAGSTDTSSGTRAPDWQEAGSGAGLPLPASLPARMAYRPMAAVGYRPDVSDADTVPLSAVLACAPGTYVTAVWGTNGHVIRQLGISCSDGSSQGPAGWTPHNTWAYVPTQFHFTCPAAPLAGQNSSASAAANSTRLFGRGFDAVIAFDEDTPVGTGTSTGQRPPMSVSGLRLRCAAVSAATGADWTLPCVGTGQRCDALSDALASPGLQRCPDGQLLAGFVVQGAQGEAGLEWVGAITQLRPLCTNAARALSPAVLTGAFSTASNTSATPSTTGSSSRVYGMARSVDRAYNLACPAGQWVVGWVGTADLWLQGLGVRCSGGGTAATPGLLVLPNPAPDSSYAYANGSSTWDLGSLSTSCASGYDAVVVEDAATWVAPPSQLSARCAGTRLFSMPGLGRATYRDSLPAAHHCERDARVVQVRVWLGSWGGTPYSIAQPAGQAPVVTGLQVTCAAVDVPRTAYPRWAPGSTAPVPAGLPSVSLPRLGRPVDAFANEVVYGGGAGVAYGTYHLLCPPGLTVSRLDVSAGLLIYALAAHCSPEGVPAQLWAPTMDGTWGPLAGMPPVVGSTLGVGPDSGLAAASFPAPMVPTVGDPVESLTAQCSSQAAAESDSVPGIRTVLDYSNPEAATRARYAASGLMVQCSGAGPDAEPAGLWGLLGRASLTQYQQEYLPVMGADVRLVSGPELYGQPAVGGSCPVGQVVIGVSVEVGSAEIAMPVPAVIAALVHCGTPGWVLTGAGLGTSGGQGQGSGGGSGVFSPDVPKGGGGGVQGGVIAAAVGGAVGGLVAALGVGVLLSRWQLRRRQRRASNTHSGGEQGPQGKQGSVEVQVVPGFHMPPTPITDRTSLHASSTYSSMQNGASQLITPSVYSELSRRHTPPELPASALVAEDQESELEAADTAIPRLLNSLMLGRTTALDVAVLPLTPNNIVPPRHAGTTAGSTPMAPASCPTSSVVAAAPSASGNAKTTAGAALGYAPGMPGRLTAGSHSVQLGPLLASGGSAWVYAGTCRLHGSVAVKVLVGRGQGDRGAADSGGAKAANALALEFALLTRLHHQHIVRCFWGCAPVESVEWEEGEDGANAAETADMDGGDMFHTSMPLPRRLDASGRPRVSASGSTLLIPSISAAGTRTRVRASADGAGDAPRIEPGSANSSISNDSVVLALRAPSGPAPVMPRPKSSNRPASLVTLPEVGPVAPPVGPSLRPTSSTSVASAQPSPPWLLSPTRWMGTTGGSVMMGPEPRLSAPSLMLVLPSCPSLSGPRSGRSGGPEPSFLVLELADGGDFAAAVHDKHLPLHVCLQLLAQVAAALAYLHSRGVAHGDVKPANVLLVGGRAKLADFGLARPCEPVPASSAPAQSGSFSLGSEGAWEDGLVDWADLGVSMALDGRLPSHTLGIQASLNAALQPAVLRAGDGAGAAGAQEGGGTVAYLAPESFGALQPSSVVLGGSLHGGGRAGIMRAPASHTTREAAPRAGGAAADIYALGCMLGEVVTRKAPWEGLRTPGIMCCVALLREQPYPAAVLAAHLGLPPGLANLVRGCCAYSAGERPCAAAVAAALQTMVAAMGQRGAGDSGGAVAATSAADLN